MTDVAPTNAQPVTMVDAYVEFNGVNLKCLCESVTLEPENKPIEITTFCGVSEYPGPVKWHFKAKFVQSFDVGGTDDALYGALMQYQADGSLPTFKVRPYEARAGSGTNPEFSGEVVPQPYTVFGGDAGAASEVDIDWIMTAEPTRTPAWAPPAGNGA